MSKNKKQPKNQVLSNDEFEAALRGEEVVINEEIKEFFKPAEFDTFTLAIIKDGDLFSIVKIPISSNERVAGNFEVLETVKNRMTAITRFKILSIQNRLLI